MEVPHTGIVIYRASRLEALLAPLSRLLEEFPPEHLLAPQTVLAAHPGIKRWLHTALARERGVAGIVANLDVQLPSSWLLAQAHRRLGVPASALAPYRREALRWRIFACLPELDDPDIRRYLDDPDPLRRRFQLADRIAGIFSRYQVYRSDWLEAWQQGRRTHPLPTTFLAPLWRRLRTGINAPQRGELLKALIQQLLQQPLGMRSEPLHVFGVSHLPPAELDVLRAVSRERLVALYLPDPCVQHWAGLSHEASELRRWLQAARPANENEVSSDAVAMGVGHPLLAAWGRLGQHFGLVLNEGEQGVLSEVRHFEDYQRAPESDARLHRLQHSLRQLQPGLMRGSEERGDASLRIHGCHTRLRELEVLRDVLLQALSDHPDLQPGQMVVMAPDIAAYAPLIPAVFGAPGDATALLPYHLADVGLASSHPVFSAFRSVLALPVARISAAAVHDLLSVPCIARALGLDASGLEQLGHWLAHARVAWGLDAASRSRLGLPAYDEHSLAWGVERMLAGYVMGDAGEPAIEALQCAPLSGVHGVQASALGALDGFLGEIDTFCREAAQARPLSQWLARLHALIDVLFVADANDGAEVEALAGLRGVVSGIESELPPADCDPLLEFAVVREVLRERLEAVPERQPFLQGGITFCGMVPQRSIPFELAAVLGLNDGEFPRGGSDGGIDLMVKAPRLGDRDLRSDDRYLFLETVMAARRQLHLSYLAEGARDGKARNPAAPLAELMAFLEEHASPESIARHGDDTVDPPWYVSHALQPFDARYFTGEDPRWFSYAAAFTEAASASDGLTPFLSRDEAQIPAPVEPIPLASVLSYYRDPARQLLRRRLNVSLDALAEAALGNDEPLSALVDPGDRLPQTLLREALQRREFALPDMAPAALRLAGLLPAGRVGARAYKRLREQVDPLLQLASEDELLRAGLPVREALVVDRTLGEFRVQGTLPRVHPLATGWMLFEAFPTKDKEAAIGFRERLPLLIEWGLLKLHALEHGGRAELCLLYPGKAQPWQQHWRQCVWSAAQWHSRLEALLQVYWRAQFRPGLYFPKTSWALATAEPGNAWRDVLQAWQGGGYVTGERDYAPGYARLLARGRDRFEDGHADGLALQRSTLELQRLLSLDEGGEVAA